MRTFAGVVACVVGVMTLTGCPPAGSEVDQAGLPGSRLPRCGDEIVCAGQFFHTGTPVVLWLDADGYNAYRAHRHFEPDQIMPAKPVAPDNPNRYGMRRDLNEQMQRRVDQEGWTLANVQGVVDQFVIHYDVCGTSRRCFEVLQDRRGLSVHFMLDLDGTIYQTLDLRERAWHAGSANDRSIGVEIANMGAYPNMDTLNQWYAVDWQGWPHGIFPGWVTETGIRTPGFVVRPSRKEVVCGQIHGRDLMQYDFTNQQYDALISLTAALARVLPNLRVDAPRDQQGQVRTDVLSKEEWESYSGLLGHWHITTNKIDPGPAFDWERVIRGTRKQLGVRD